MTRQRLLAVDELGRGELRRVEVAGFAICVARTEQGRVFALRDACTHYSVKLSRGTLLGDDLECPAHASMFNVVTGAVTGLPACDAVQTYPVTVEGGDAYVELPEERPPAEDRIDDDDFEEADVP